MSRPCGQRVDCGTLILFNGNNNILGGYKPRARKSPRHLKPGRPGPRHTPHAGIPCPAGRRRGTWRSAGTEVVLVCSIVIPTTVWLFPGQVPLEVGPLMALDMCRACLRASLLPAARGVFCCWLATCPEGHAWLCHSRQSVRGGNFLLVVITRFIT